MSTTAAPRYSVRERIVEHVAELVASMEAGVPETDPYNTTFSFVTRGELGDLSKGKVAAAAVFDPSQEKNDLFPLTDCTLTIGIEFDVRHGKELDETRSAQVRDRRSAPVNTILADLERLVLSDRTLGGLAVDTRVLRDETDGTGPFPEYVTGTIFFAVRYRHQSGDPRRLIDE